MSIYKTVALCHTSGTSAPCVTAVALQGLKKKTHKCTYTIVIHTRGTTLGSSSTLVKVTVVATT